MFQVLLWSQVLLIVLFVYVFVGRVAQKLYRILLPKATYFSDSRICSSESYDCMPLLWPVLLPIVLAIYCSDKLISTLENNPEKRSR